ncbi:MAG: EcsC family protein [Actinomycetota bacterium]
MTRLTVQFTELRGIIRYMSQQGADESSSADAHPAFSSVPAENDNTGLSAHSGTVVERLLALGLDGRGPFASAQSVADGALSGHGDAEQAVDAVVRSHVRLAAAGGFVTGLGGFVTLPVALPANVIEFYTIATRMVGATASLRGYDVHLPGVRSAVMLTLVGADADDVLRRAGIKPTGRLAHLATQRLPGPVVMMVNKGVGFRLVTRAGRAALPRFGKSVPVVGGVIGAGVDVYLLRRIADHARREFPHSSAAISRSVENPPTGQISVPLTDQES